MFFITVYINFDGSSSEVTFVDIFDYKAEKGKMEISGYASFIGDSGDGEKSELDYKIKDDVMTIQGANGDPEELIRVK